MLAREKLTTHIEIDNTEFMEHLENEFSKDITMTDSHDSRALYEHDYLVTLAEHELRNRMCWKRNEREKHFWATHVFADKAN